MLDADVAVIGAGPSGAVAAGMLARAGRQVLLLDPGFAGIKPGDALPGAAGRLLRACDLPLPGDAHRPLGGNISVWGGPEPAHRDFMADPDGAGWRLDRRAFEAGLVAAAEAAGATCRPEAVRGAKREGDLWQVKLRAGGSLTARWLIDATGRAALLARKLGARRHRDEDLVALVARARPDLGFALQRSLVETVPQGWWYAALQPDGAPVFMLHTTPSEAGRLLADPAAWQAALAATSHISTAFPDPIFDSPPNGFEACGAWLEPVHGDGWLACGDAALSFDPCAAQGIFSALWGGMVAAKAVLDGELTVYATQLADIRRTYRARVQMHYAQEQRWQDEPFWTERRRGPHPPATRAPPSPAKGGRGNDINPLPPFAGEGGER
jgi:flavin-dependent dehydrogenase